MTWTDGTPSPSGSWSETTSFAESWTDATSSTTTTWSATTSATETWTTPSGASALGNLSRFIDADPLADGSGGVDFNNTFSSENPWVFTTYGSVSFRSNREDPV